MAEGGVPGVEDVARLGRWLARNGITGGDGPPAVRLIGGGRSNLTYRLDVGAADGPSRGRLVLRRPPPGHVLPTAHDMAREYRVLTALAGTAVPVPRPVAICEGAVPLRLTFAVSFTESRMMFNVVTSAVRIWARMMPPPCRFVCRLM